MLVTQYISGWGLARGFSLPRFPELGNFQYPKDEVAQAQTGYRPFGVSVQGNTANQGIAMHEQIILPDREPGQQHQKDSHLETVNDEHNTQEAAKQRSFSGVQNRLHAFHLTRSGSMAGCQTTDQSGAPAILALKLNPAGP
jgi:hypothetical protein